jgi:hypothetical protein
MAGFETGSSPAINARRAVASSSNLLPEPADLSPRRSRRAMQPSSRSPCARMRRVARVVGEGARLAAKRALHAIAQQRVVPVEQ